MDFNMEFYLVTPTPSHWPPSTDLFLTHLMTEVILSPIFFLWGFHVPHKDP